MMAICPEPLSCAHTQTHSAQGCFFAGQGEHLFCPPAVPPSAGQRCDTMPQIIPTAPGRRAFIFGMSGRIVLNTPSTFTAKSLRVAATMSEDVPVVSSDTPAFAMTRSIGAAPAGRRARARAGAGRGALSSVGRSGVASGEHRVQCAGKRRERRAVDAGDELLHPLPVCDVHIAQLHRGAPGEDAEARRESSGQRRDVCLCAGSGRKGAPRGRVARAHLASQAFPTASRRALFLPVRASVTCGGESEARERHQLVRPGGGAVHRSWRGR